MKGRNKKAIASALALTMAVPVSAWAGSSTYTPVPKAVSVPAFSAGDVDGSGEVDLDDALLTLKMALKITPEVEVSEQQIAAANVDGNDSVDLDDALQILKWALIIEPYPSQQPIASVEPTASAEPSDTGSPSASEETPAQSQEPAPSVAPTGKDPVTPPPAQSKKPIVQEVYELKTLTAEAVTYEGVVDTPVLAATNGAIVEDGIYTLTEQNEASAMGIRFVWPYVGRTDLIQTVEEAGITTGAVESVPQDYKNETWLKTHYMEIPDDYVYPRPHWSNGISVSFWSKQKWSLDGQSNIGPLMVIKRTQYCDTHLETSAQEGYGDPKNRHGQEGDTDFGLVLYSNGSVIYNAGDDGGHNNFHTTNYVSDEDDTWTFYTVTIANDWITVYVNGEEMVYHSVYLSKDKAGKTFNDGFLTRYSPAAWITQEMLDEDNAERGYLTSKGSRIGAWVLKTDAEDVPENYELNWESTISGNSRYSGTYSNHKQLLIDLLTEEGTELWFGGVWTCSVDNDNLGGFSTYNASTSNGSQVTGVQCYPTELSAGEAAYIYQQSKEEYKELLGLADGE